MDLLKCVCGASPSRSVVGALHRVYCWECDAGTPPVMSADAAAAAWNAMQQALRAQSVQPAMPRGIVGDEDMRWLRRFAECCADPDADGHDAPRLAITRLERLGALRPVGRGRSDITVFGNALLSDGQDPLHADAAASGAPVETMTVQVPVVVIVHQDGEPWVKVPWFEPLASERMTPAAAVAQEDLAAIMARGAFVAGSAHVITATLPVPQPPQVVEGSAEMASVGGGQPRRARPARIEPEDGAWSDQHGMWI